MKTPRTTDCQIVLRLTTTQKRAIKLAANLESRSMNNWLIQAVQAQLKAKVYPGDQHPYRLFVKEKEQMQ